jgi:hypothetical protein
MSGIGKLSIANEFGHRFNDNSLNQFVYWMRSDENNLEDGELDGVDDERGVD